MYKKKKQIDKSGKYTVIDDFLPRHQFLELKSAIMLLTVKMANAANL